MEEDDYRDEDGTKGIDDSIVEAVLNIKDAIRRIAPAVTYLRDEELSGSAAELDEALADLEQAVRYLEGKEEPT